MSSDGIPDVNGPDGLDIMDVFPNDENWDDVADALDENPFGEDREDYPLEDETEEEFGDRERFAP